VKIIRATQFTAVNFHSKIKQCIWLVTRQRPFFYYFTTKQPGATWFGVFSGMSPLSEVRMIFSALVEKR